MELNTHHGIGERYFKSTIHSYSFSALKRATKLISIIICHLHLMLKDENLFFPLDIISANFSFNFDCYVLLRSTHKIHSQVSAKTTIILINMMLVILLMSSFGNEYSDFKHIFPLFQGRIK